MTEETQDIVQDNQQVVPEQEAANETTVETTEARTEFPTKAVDQNWARVHTVLEAQKAEIDALKAELQKKAAPPEPEEEPDELDGLDPSEYLTVAQVKAANARSERRAEKKAHDAARQAAAEIGQQHAIAAAEAQAKATHDDYDYVVTNFAIPLIKNDPALAHKVMNSKNPAETAYKLGKLSDSYEEQMTKQQTSPKAEKILQNTRRPTSSNAVSSSLKTTADKYSNMSKAEVWEQSQKFARQA